MKRSFKRIPKGGETVEVDELPVRSLPPKAEVAEMRWSVFVPPFVVGAIMVVQSYAAVRTWGVANPSTIGIDALAVISTLFVLGLAIRGD